MVLFLSKLQQMIIRVLYYYFYLFYKKIWRENDPHLATVLSLSFIFSLFVNGVIDVILASFLGFSLTKYYKMGVLIVITIIMYYTFLKNGKGNIIVSKEKPKLKNDTISKTISILFFILAILLLFLKADIIRFILHK